MTKKKKAIIIVVSVLLAFIIGVGSWLVAIRVKSKKYNLTVVDTSAVTAPTATEADFEGEVTLSTGITMHYARYGSTGEPLLLIHGNGGSHLSLEELALYFAADYTVYAMDSRSQGQSSYVDDISYALMAADVQAFCDEMNIVKPLVIGHSDGGIIALQIAIDYPDLMKAFVSCGANSSPKAFKLYFTLPIKIRYKSNPRPLDRIMIEEPDFTVDKLEKITCAAFIVAGEYDIMYLGDTAYLYENVKGAKVAIIKGGGHSYIRDGATGYALCKPFFDSLE